MPPLQAIYLISEIKEMKDKFPRTVNYVRKEKYQRYHKINNNPSHEENMASTEFSTRAYAMTDELQEPGLFRVTIAQVLRDTASLISTVVGGLNFCFATGVHI